MQGTHVLIQLAGAVALLLWGTHMVSSSLLLGFGTLLRNWLSRLLHNRGLSVLAGAGLTTLLQSSTAASMMTVSLTSSGVLPLVPALAVMLGANIGTTLVVQALSFDTSLLAPLLLLAGLVLYRCSDYQRLESAGQALIGLGLMLTALAFLHLVLEQVEGTDAFAAIIRGLSGDAWMLLLVTSLVTWICHSSVSTVLLIASLSASGLITYQDSLVMVLGANLGGALPALFGAGNRAARRLPMGNLLIRLAGCLFVLPLTGWLAQQFQPLASLDRFAVYFHTLFNLVLAAVFIGLLPILANLLVRLMPEAPDRKSVV